MKRNDIIFEENPVITGPPQSIGPHFCANCSQPLTDGVLQGKNTINTNKYMEGHLISKANCQTANLPKNKQMDLFLLVCDVFSLVFWKKWKTPKRKFDILAWVRFKFLGN